MNLTLLEVHAYISLLYSNGLADLAQIEIKISGAMIHHLNETLHSEKSEHSPLMCTWQKRHKNDN